MIKCAVLDLDGTILDSMGYWEKAEVDYLKNLGIEINQEQSEEFLSLSFPEGIDYLKRTFNITLSPKDIEDGINDIMEYNYLNNIKIKGEFLKLFEVFKAHNIRCAIASATDKYLIELAIKKQGLDKYIEYILSSTDVGTSKKHPDIYLMCSEYLGAKPEESLIFEDLPYGLIATRGLGFTRIGIFDENSIYLQDKLKNDSDFYFEAINDASIKVLEDFIESKQDK